MLETRVSLDLFHLTPRKPANPIKVEKHWQGKPEIPEQQGGRQAPNAQTSLHGAIPMTKKARQCAFAYPCWTDNLGYKGLLLHQVELLEAPDGSD